jgi:aryl-alcohol dehydrogenase-like predicted oxidoreductase
MAEAEWRDPARLRALIRSHLSQSEALLGAHTVRMVLLHQSDLPFLSSSSTSESMLELKADYPERRFGVSVYTLEEASCAIELPWVSAVQFPVNLVDRRFLNQHFISTCRERGIVRIARSLFLQGVLTSATPVPSVKKRELLERLRASLLSGMQCLSLEEAALRYIFGTCGDLLDIGLLGVHSVNELERNLSMLERVDSLPETVLDAIEEGRMIVERHHLFDPRAWNL